MKRDARLIEISRREFCTLAGCLGLAVAACGGDAASTPDAAPPDGAVSATCSGAPAIDVGAASSFAVNQPVLFASHNVYVIRDGSGLYAISSRCTHAGGQNNVVQGHFVCPLHGAEFSFNGDVQSGPAFIPLSHFEMCTLGGGHVGVSPSKTVSATTRLNA